MPIIPGIGSSTYSPADAVALVKAFGHGIPLTAPQANLCDIVNSTVWIFFPWGWSIGTILPIPLLDGIQDYSPAETDILRPVRPRIVRTDTTPDEFRELDILDNLAPELTIKGGLDSIQAVGWRSDINKFRFDRAISISGTQTLQLQADYQRAPTKITDNNLTVPFSFPDHFYGTFVEGLKWKIYQLGDDPRAGNIVIDKRGTVQYTGQLGVFVDSLNVMARTEDLSQGDQFQFPASPMGVSRAIGPGLFGFGM